MSRVRPGWDPPSHNAPGLYAYGAEFNVVTPVVANGVWWYQADGEGGIADVAVFMYDAAEQVLATGAALAASISLGWNFIPYASPPLLPIANGYVWTAEQNGEASFDSTEPPYPYNSPGGEVTVIQGRYQDGGGFPNSTWTGQHGTDLDISAADEPAEGSADIGLTLAVATSGSRASAGAAAAGVTLAADATGARSSAGDAASQLQLAIAATGARDSNGTAAAGLVLTVAAAGRRPASGSSDLQLVLAAAATGSDGSAALGASPPIVTMTRPQRITTNTGTPAITTSTRTPRITT